MNPTPLLLPSQRNRRFRDRLLFLGFALAGMLGLSAPAAHAQQKLIAYAVPAGTVGNQAFGGSLGMDFNVQNPIKITRLGVFDDNSDGLNLPIVARLFNRSTQEEVAMIEFTPEDAGDLIGGSRFKALPEVLTLDVGFEGTIVAEGYGVGEQLRNGMGNDANITWTVNAGDGSLEFVGLSRYGDAGWFPATADGGPAARYAAGTFEFETTPPLQPGKPSLKLSAGNQQCVLEWSAVTQPLPAAKYRVHRSPTLDGPYQQIAEVTTLTYTDSGLVNGTAYYYNLRAIAANGRESADSDPQYAAPYALATDHHLAYALQRGAAGGQNFGGALGHDFDVDNPILVTQLGVFDSKLDGLFLTITARIYNRDTMEALVQMDFTPEEPGTATGGSRLKPLTEPLRLEAGFKGTVVTEGYGADELVYNSGGNTNNIFWTLGDANGSLRFVGSSRWGANFGEFPPNADGGPAARYGAGTFEFQSFPPERPGIPTVTVLRPAEDAAATLSWNAVLLPLPAAKYVVQRAANADGPFTQIAEVTELTYRDLGLANGVPVFYRVHAIASGGQVGFDSAVVTTTPQPRAAGVAYVNPIELTGNQAFGGSLGMDFDVARPVQVTKLGVFDSNADGLFLTLNARLYDRTTRTALAALTFTPEEPGELIEGSRFKSLASPVYLPAGFKGTIVADGYGTDEPLFNTGNRPDDVAKLATFEGGSLLFVGVSGYSVNAGEFSGTPDQGPANRYAAGTFYFEPLPETPPTLSISLTGGKVKITWTGAGTLEGASQVTGSWTPVSNATSGMEITPTEPHQFYRVKQ